MNRIFSAYQNLCCHYWFQKEFYCCYCRLLNTCLIRLLSIKLLPPKKFLTEGLNLHFLMFHFVVVFFSTILLQSCSIVDSYSFCCFPILFIYKFIKVKFSSANFCVVFNILMITKYEKSSIIFWKYPSPFLFHL